MKKNIIYMAALAIMAAACSSEDETTVTSPEHSGKGEVKMITETIRATNGDGATRAAIDADAAFSWSKGDQIAVHVNDGSYYNTDALASGGNNAADFTVTYKGTRDAFAVYPASIVAANAANYGQENTALDVTLPPSYTLAEVSGTTTPCPMIADNDPDVTAVKGWAFYQLCGLLRLSVSNIPTTAKRLEISFGGKKVCGDFSIASPVTPGESVIKTSDDANNDVISIKKDGTDAVLGSESLVLNIPLPTGTYSSIFVFAYDALEGGNPTVVDFFSFSKDVARKGGKKFTATMKYVAKDLADESFNNSTIDYAYIYQRNASAEATQHTVTIADGQTVILSGVNINANNTNAIVCEGNANIVLDGSNTVRSMSANGTLDKAVIKAGTYGSSTLTISGDGILNASPNHPSSATTKVHNGAVIGADSQGSCGDIVINGGTITVSSTNYGAGIGAGRVGANDSKCGTITIAGGTVNATSSSGAGIGSGSHISQNAGTSHCDGIIISGGKVTARSYDGAAIGSGKEEGGGNAHNAHSYCKSIEITGGTIDAQTTQTNNYAGSAAIGSGYNSTAGTITISGGNITAKSGRHAAGIGAGAQGGKCGSISINGGSIDASGGYEGAGIGTGRSSASNNLSTCGTITITSGVTKVTASNGRNTSTLYKSIGRGYAYNSAASCGKITIGGTETGEISTNPYTYQP